MVEEFGEDIPPAVFSVPSGSGSMRTRVECIRNHLRGMCRVSHQRHLNPDP
jgi:hypothetical protein